MLKDSLSSFSKASSGDMQTLVSHVRRLKPDLRARFVLGQEFRLQGSTDCQKQGCYTVAYQELIKKLGFTANMGQRTEQDLSSQGERDLGKAFALVKTPSTQCLQPLKPFLTSLLERFEGHTDRFVSEIHSEKIKGSEAQCTILQTSDALHAVQSELWAVLFTRASMRMTERGRHRLARRRVSDCDLFSTVSASLFEEVGMGDRICEVIHQLAVPSWAGFILKSGYWSIAHQPTPKIASFNSGSLVRSTHRRLVQGEELEEHHWYDASGNRVF